MFEKESADNVETLGGQPEVIQPVSPTEDDIDQTKAYSERLKKDRAKIQQETLDNLARDLGYDNNADMMEHMRTQELIKAGIDPDVIRPIIKDYVQKDPEYLEAKRLLKEREQTEKDAWAKQEIERVNKKFGTEFASVDDLPKNVVDLWNKGVSLEKAYVAENVDAVIEKERKKVSITGKEHLAPSPTTGKNVEGVVNATPEQMLAFKRINPDATEEQIKNYLAKKK